MIIQQEFQFGSVTGFVSDYLLHFSKAILSLRELSASLPYDQLAMLHTSFSMFSTLTFNIENFLIDSLSCSFFSDSLSCSFFFSVQRKVD